MPTVILRFYGRFVYASGTTKEGDPTREIAAIAPRFTPPLCEHRPTMCIPRSAIDLDNAATLTNLPPTLRLVSDQKDVLEAELFVWDLEATNVSITPDESRGPSPSATLEQQEPDRIIPDLSDLVNAIGEPAAVLDPGALTASAAGKAQAVINITEGAGLAKAAVDLDAAFLVEKSVALADLQPTAAEVTEIVATKFNTRAGAGESVPFKNADVVDFTLGVDRNMPLTFVLSSPQGTGQVTVVPKREDSVVVVSFSHLCSRLPTDEVYDLEFAQYYALLETDPGDKALILLPNDTGGEMGDCHAMARMTFVR